MSERSPGKMSLGEYTQFVISLYIYIQVNSLHSDGQIKMRILGKNKDESVYFSSTRLRVFLQEHLFTKFPSCTVQLGRFICVAAKPIPSAGKKTTGTEEITISIKDFMGFIASACIPHVRT